jgi:hypothetical protein
MKSADETEVGDESAVMKFDVDVEVGGKVSARQAAPSTLA